MSNVNSNLHTRIDDIKNQFNSQKNNNNELESWFNNLNDETRQILDKYEINKYDLESFNLSGKKKNDILFDLQMKNVISKFDYLRFLSNGKVNLYEDIKPAAHSYKYYELDVKQCNDNNNKIQNNFFNLDENIGCSLDKAFCGLEPIENLKGYNNNMISGFDGSNNGFFSSIEN
jgi:hypothetical protein